MPPKRHNIAIVGRGKVGQSLACLFISRGHTVVNLGRDTSGRTASLAGADIVLICVNDGSIEEVCLDLVKDLRPQSVVCHCSGALDSSILESAHEVGCYTASCHPLNTFPTLASSLRKFASIEHGSYLYAEGQDSALKQLMPLFEDCGFRTTQIDTESKVLYHAACVFACNYLTSLMHMSLETASGAGLDDKSFWQSLQPIIQSTLENIGEVGTHNALSGPIARGDTETVKSHVQALGDHSKRLNASYAHLGIRSLELAIENGGLSTSDAKSIAKLLDVAD